MDNKHSQVQPYTYTMLTIVYHIWLLATYMCHTLIIEILTYAAFWFNTYQSDYITDN